MAANAASTLPGSLPIPRTRLIGREAERAAAKAFLIDEAVPLLTLTGPGGVGKTRLAKSLAQDVIEHFPDGVVWVDLAPVGDPALVLPATAQTLGLRDSGDQSMAEQLVGFLRPRALLVVLDNFEHLLDAAPQLSGLLSNCPRLQILVTSRSVLSLSGEHDLLVPPLRLPPSGTPDLNVVATSEAIQLFLERARAVRPDFGLTDANAVVVTAVCRRLDGLPLAIELASARLAHLPLAALHHRLEQRLPLLTGGPRDLPARLQTMRDAIAWSYDLLSADEQVLFRRLAIFVGGFTLEAAERIAEGVSALPQGESPSAQGEKENGGSLTRPPAPPAGAQRPTPPEVQRPAPPEAATRLPPRERSGTPSVLDGIASLVDKSLAQLIAGQGSEPRYQLLETIREFGLEQLADSGEEEALGRLHAHNFADLAECFGPEVDGSDQRAALAPLDADEANLRAAVGWAIDHEERALALRIAVNLWSYWFTRGRFREGTGWTERALALPGEAPLGYRILALNNVANMSSYIGEYDRAAASAQALLELASREHHAIGEGLGLYQLSFVARHAGDHDTAVERAEAALARFRALPCTPWLPYAAQRAGLERLGRGDLDRAASLLREAVNLFLEMGNEGGTLMGLCNLAYALHRKGDVNGADLLLRAVLKRELALEREYELADVLLGLADIALARRQVWRAALLLGAIEAMSQSIGYARYGWSRDAFERIADSTRSVLGEDDFAALWRQGTQLTVPEAATEALAVSHEWSSSASSTDEANPATVNVRLTSRERDVLRLLVEGYSDRQIAAALSISPKTAGNHVSRILAKLEVETRTAAATQAVRRGLV